jgi:hypothetical protein
MACRKCASIGTNDPWSGAHSPGCPEAVLSALRDLVKWNPHMTGVIWDTARAVINFIDHKKEG